MAAMKSTDDYFEAAKERLVVDKAHIREQISNAIPHGVDPEVKEQIIEEKTEVVVETVDEQYAEMGIEKAGDDYIFGFDLIDDNAPVSSVSLDDADNQDEISESLRSLGRTKQKAEKIYSDTIDAAVKLLSEDTDASTD